MVNCSGSVYGLTVITFETHNAGLSFRNPSRQAKIPDICDVFGVQTKDLYYMMHKLNIQL